MNDRVEYLDLDDVIDLARTLLGDPPPIRDVGLLGSAAAQPQVTAFGHDAYPDVLTKAAALLQSFVDNHALVDGNKRLGWLATAVFLELNGFNASKSPNNDVTTLSSGLPRQTRPSRTAQSDSHGSCHCWWPRESAHWRPTDPSR